MAHFGSKALFALAAALSLSACAAATPAPPASQAHGILQSSTPADGASVNGPVNQLRLRFSPPARLGEVTVTGGDGMKMPMMVTAVGEVADYVLPLPGLEAGAYTVEWQATAAGSSHQGSFRFTVR